MMGKCLYNYNTPNFEEPGLVNKNIKFQVNNLILFGVFSLDGKRLLCGISTVYEKDISKNILYSVDYNFKFGQPIGKFIKELNEEEIKQQKDKLYYEKLEKARYKNEGFNYFISNYSNYVPEEEKIVDGVYKWLSDERFDCAVECAIELVLTEVLYIIKKVGERSVHYRHINLLLDIDMLINVVELYNNVGKNNSDAKDLIKEVRESWGKCPKVIPEGEDTEEIDEMFYELKHFYDRIKMIDMGYKDIWMD